MRKNIVSLLVLLGLLACASSYTLQGPYKLDIDGSFQQISPDTEVIFNFHKDVEGEKIVNRVTVYGCAAANFRYTISNSDITFIYENTLATQRECASNQIGEIRLKMEKVVYTVTLSSSLLFLSPSGKYVFKLKKVKQNVSPSSLAGVWEAVEVQNVPSSIVVRGNDTNIQFCGGNASLAYQLSTKNDARFVIEKASGCSENEFLTSLFKTRYYRSKGKDLLFYDDNYNINSYWNSLGSLPGSAPLASNSPNAPASATGQQPSTTTRPAVVPNPTATASNENKNTVTVQSTNITTIKTDVKQPPQPQPQPPATQQNKIPVPSKAQISPQAPVKVSLPNPNPTVTSSIPPAAPTGVGKEVKKAEEANKNQAHVGSKLYLNPIIQSDIVSKWYSHSTGDKSKILIITPSRLMIYGSCGVYYSSFTFGTPEKSKLPLIGLQVKNTSPDCTNDKDIFAKALSQTAYASVEVKNGTKTLDLFSKEGTLLNSFDTIVPT